MYLEKIKAPSDVKALGGEELGLLAVEMRAALLKRVSLQGGHVGPNLGAVELTIAMAYALDIPRDKVVFDVSHQTYPYKMLTGRAFGYLDASRFSEVSGYSSPAESPVYDNFEVGHTSTSVALAAGLQKARDMRGGVERIVAVIGDGSLSGGEAFEGLDTAAELGTGIVVIVNDNEMSIAENHGGLYGNLRLLRKTGGHAPLNFFKAMGFDYRYLEEGNDIGALIKALEEVKDSPRPVVLHVHTEKGHGYAPAAAEKESFHYSGPFDILTGKPVDAGEENCQTLLGRYLAEKVRKDSRMAVIVAGTPGAMGLTKRMREEMGKQYLDVGIAEECAAAVSSGLAKGGMRPVWSVFGTFVQRAYDQIAQDICVNSNPAVINVTGCSVYGMNDITHLCLFDIPMLSHIPGLVYLAPTTWEEFTAMEDWAVAQNERPVAIRVPASAVKHGSGEYGADYGGGAAYKIERRGSRVAILALGDFFQKGEKTADMLQKKGISATLVNPRWISDLDEETLDSLKADHTLVVTLEDGVLDGGFGERVARYLGPSGLRVLCRGIRKGLYDRYDAEELLRENRLTEEQIAGDILDMLS